jgi:hypothetical protein
VDRARRCATHRCQAAVEARPRADLVLVVGRVPPIPGPGAWPPPLGPRLRKRSGHRAFLDGRGGEVDPPPALAGRSVQGRAAAGARGRRSGDGRREDDIPSPASLRRCWPSRAAVETARVRRPGQPGPRTAPFWRAGEALDPADQATSGRRSYPPLQPLSTIATYHRQRRGVVVTASRPGGQQCVEWCGHALWRSILERSPPPPGAGPPAGARQSAVR